MVTIQQVKPLEWCIKCEDENEVEILQKFLVLLGAIKNVSHCTKINRAKGSLVKYPIISDFDETKESSQYEKDECEDPIEILKATPNYEINHVSLVFEENGLQDDHLKFLKKVSEESEQLEQRGLLSSVIPYVTR